MNKEILAIAVPAIISNITVPLLGLADLTIVGHIGGADYISAIATGSMIFNVIYWIFGFLRMGTSGMTAQAYGRRSAVATTAVLSLSLRTAVAIGLFFVVMQVPVLRFMIWAMNTPAESVTFVGQYFDIVVWGAPAMLTLYAANGWFIGMQDSRLPMAIAIIQNVVNIVASLLFVFVLHWKIEGIAAGTLIAQWSGALMAAAGMVWLRRRTSASWAAAGASESSAETDASASLGQDCNQQNAAPATQSNDAATGNHAAADADRVSLRNFFAVNRDIFLRTLCLVAVNLYFVSAGGRQGSLILAVNALLMTLYTLFSYFMDGFAYAGEALCGKYYGAGDSVSFRSLVRRLYVWGAAMTVVFTVLYAVGGQDFLGLLTSDTHVVRAAMRYLPWAVAIPVCGVMAFIYDGVFIGVTATRGMLVSSALATALFFVLYLSLSATLANDGLWIAFLAYLACRGAVQGVIVHKSKFMSV